MAARWVPALLVLTLCPAARGQLPEVRRFDPLRLEVKKTGESWRIMSQDQVLKEFRRSEDAHAALRLIRDLRCNQHGTVGRKRPVIEYWLSDGRPPVGLGINRLPLVEFDAKSLRVEQGQGQWLVRDGVRPLFGFGGSEADARQALAVLERYQFNRVGYIGDPPAMMYFLSLPEPSPHGGGKHPPKLLSPLALLPLPTLAGANPFQVVAEPGDEERLAINWQRCGLLLDGATWKLTEDHRTLAVLGTSHLVASEALRVLQQYRFTEQCRTGNSPQSFRCYLVNGQAPRGVPPGMRAVPFRPEQLSLRQHQGAWMIWNVDQPLMAGGASFEEGQKALRIIHAHGFNRLCWVGNPTGEGFQFLVKE